MRWRKPFDLVFGERQHPYYDINQIQIINPGWSLSIKILIDKNFLLFTSGIFRERKVEDARNVKNLIYQTLISGFIHRFESLSFRLDRFY